MGEGRCVWVPWDTGGMNNTKTSHAGGMEGVSAQDLGAMAGEISPDIMFWCVWGKVVWMGVDGCKACWMGANEPIYKKERKNKEKRAPNGREWDVL